MNVERQMAALRGRGTGRRSVAAPIVAEKLKLNRSTLPDVVLFIELPAAITKIRYFRSQSTLLLVTCLAAKLDVATC
jgi:hypothetical protein